MRPFVMVGVGGSGGKTLRVVREVLRQRLERLGWEDPWPQAWQLVHIDVPAEPDGVTEELPFRLTGEQNCPLAKHNSTYEGFDHTVAQVKGDALARYHAYDSWRPFPPETVDVEIVYGAGQYRAVGRVAVQAKLDIVDKRLRKALNAAASAPSETLARLDRLLTGREAELGTNAPVVMVLGSAAGGSGSGMLLDVCDVLGGMGQQHQIAVVFAPELFEGQDGATSGLAPNTFMAINELSNAMWVNSAANQPRSRGSLFARAGVQAPVGRSGPSAVVLVGSTNSNDIALGKSAEIYKVMGRALGEMMLDARLMSAFESVAMGNQQAQQLGATNHYPIRVASNPMVPQFRGMGFARLSIGRDLLLRYSAERLARAAAKRLLEYHIMVREPGDDTTDSEMVERVADQLQARFIEATGLRELGPNDNDVIDALWPDGSGALFQGWSNKTIKGIVPQMQGKKEAQAVIGQWVAEAAESNMKFGRQTVRSDFEAQLFASAKTWVDRVQGSLEVAIRQLIADAGLPVSITLLDRLASYVVEAAGELKRDARIAVQRRDEQLSLLRTPQTGRGDKVPAEPEAVAGIVETGTRALKLNSQAKWYEVASDLLLDLSENLVRPWRRSLVDAEALLREEVYPKSGSSSEVDYWPGDDDAVPGQYQPSKVEFLLEDYTSFPRLFHDMIWRSVDDPQAPAQALEQAVREVVRGPIEDAPAGLPLLTSVTKRWTPTLAEARRSNDIPGAGRAVAAVSVDDLLSRASAWISDSRKYSGQFLKQSIIEFLADQDVDAGVRLDRETTLVGQFREMLRASEPLVSVNARMLSLLHGGREVAESQIIMSNLCVPNDAKLRQRIRDAAVEVGVDADRVPFVLDPHQSCETFRLHTSTAYHFAFDSVMETLAKRWSQAEEDRGLMDDFWRWRRTRPLSEWVPVDADTRRALVRGWFIGRLLGHARFAHDERQRLRLEVLDYLTEGGGFGAMSGDLLPSDKGEWTTMPARGPRRTTRGEAPANVLELLSVGLIDAYRQVSLEPLRPWGALINLGHELQPIQEWVATGAGWRQDGSPLLDMIEGESEDASAQRLAELDRWLEKLRQQTDSKCAVPPHVPPSDLQQSPLREIYDDVVAALADIRLQGSNGRIYEEIG